MRELIGETAGKIWRTLGEKAELNIAQLGKVVKEKSDIVYQSLGWLARENKIKYNKKGDKTFISLTENEREVFSKPH